MRRVSWKENLLETFLGIIERHPRVLIAAAFLLAFLSLFYTARFLTFKTNRNDLVSPQREYNQIYLRYQEEFGKELDSLVVVVESPDIERGKAFVLRLARMLEKDRAHIKEVIYRIDPGYFRDKALLYLSLADLEELRSQLKTHRDFLQALVRRPTLNTLFAQINRKASSKAVSTLISGLLGAPKPAPSSSEDSSIDLGFVQAVLRQMNAYLQGSTTFVSPWETFFVTEKKQITHDGFYVSENEKLLFLLVSPVEKQESFTPAGAALARIRRDIAALRAEFPEVQAGVTGTPALAADEMAITKHDTMIASLVSLLGIGILFALVFRRMHGPLYALLTLLLAIAWSFGFLTLTIGSLNVLTVVFTTILIGLGIDFGIHFISRYNEERAGGKNMHEALEATFRGTSAGIITGGLTTSLAFYTTVLADFRGINELGFIAGSGILLCLLAMLTILPAFLVLKEQRRKYSGERVEKKGGRGRRLCERFLLYPRPVLMVGGLLTLLSLFALPRLSFDYNLLNLQAHGTESVEYERKILQNSARSTWFGVVIADSLDEARRKKALLEALPSVSKVESILPLIPQEQEKKLRLLQGLRPLLAPLSFASFPAELDLPALVSTLEKLKFKLRSRKKRSGPTPAEVRQEIDRFLSRVEQAEETQVVAALTTFQKALFQDFQDKLRFLQDHLHPSPVTLATLPPQLRKRFIGRSGRLLLQVFPKEDIWERKFLTAFVADLRSVDPQATGAPIQVYESSRLMKEGFEEAGLYALLAIIVLTLLDFRSPRSALFSLVPLGVGASWMAGLMVLFGVQFNLANLLVLPLIVGIGVDNGIHILHRYREEERENGQAGPRHWERYTPCILKSTGKAVTISSLTTMLGFGSLMVAKHQGIFSLGLVLTLGIGSILVASLTVLPALIHYWLQKGWRL
ncbi:MAG: hypothetical protein D6736_11195 [Nitrospinota bacterium]|nr:MAG: hypothetical protein D6736_11195 [Nitrospinota bacterium]